jgi:hypothetical protein
MEVRAVFKDYRSFSIESEEAQKSSIEMNLDPQNSMRKPQKNSKVTYKLNPIAMDD